MAAPADTPETTPENTPEKILEKMDTLLDQLISNSDQLKRLSQQVVSEAELVPLQRMQEELLRELALLDELFKQAPIKPNNSLLKRKIGQKLAQFQALNAHFIDNLKSHKGLLQFEIPHPKKRH